MFITAFTSARLIKFKAAYLDLADRQWYLYRELIFTKIGCFCL